MTYLYEFMGTCGVAENLQVSGVGLYLYLYRYRFHGYGSRLDLTDPCCTRVPPHMWVCIRAAVRVQRELAGGSGQ